MKKYHFNKLTLVAEHFVNNPDPTNKIEVDHKNDDVTDNCATNLEWLTHKENMIKAGASGLMSRFEKQNGNCKLSDRQVIKIRKLFTQGKTDVRKLAEKYNMSIDYMRDIVKSKARNIIKVNKKAA